MSVINGQWMINTAPGVILKDEVIIMFHEGAVIPTYIVAIPEGTTNWNRTTYPSEYFLCIEYEKLDKKIANDAKLVVLREKEINEKIHYKLYSLIFNDPWTNYFNQLAPSLKGDGDKMEVTHPETLSKVSMKELVKYFQYLAEINRGSVGAKGDPGRSAYDELVDGGFFKGTHLEWIEFLRDIIQRDRMFNYDLIDAGQYKLSTDNDWELDVMGFDGQDLEAFNNGVFAHQWPEIQDINVAIINANDWVNIKNPNQKSSEDPDQNKESFTILVGGTHE